ncbi:MAG TPA: hypothetical protein VK171_16430 [Fimbriimonas sp.]|nr:hypothetical protein [Fimbriimonas sp.]
MKLRTIMLATLCLATTMAYAQATPANTAASGGEIMLKITKLDFLRSINPLLLTKQQLLQLLGTMDKCKAKEMEIRALDVVELKKLEAEIDKNLTAAIEKADLPNRDFQNKIVAVQEALLIRRRIATNEMVDMLWETVKKNLNDGQIAAMGGLFNPKDIDPKLDPAKMTAEDKARIYIKYIFLDGLAYELMNQLYKHAK